MRATDAWIRRENYKKKSNICKYRMQFNAKKEYFVLVVIFFFPNNVYFMFVWLYVLVCLCTVYEIWFAFCSCQVDTNGKVAGKRHFLSNSMVNLYVLYGVYMCKTCRFTIFGTTLVLLSFTFLTCFAFVVYHFFTCRPDFNSTRCSLFYRKTKTREKVKWTKF